MGGRSAASPSKGDEEEEGDDDHSPSPCREMSSRCKSDHPPVFQSNVEAEGSETSALFQPPYPLDSRHSYYNDPASAYKLAANIVTPADQAFFENMGFEKWRSDFSELSARVISFLAYSFLQTFLD